MSTENVKEIVKEKYGNAALRVTRAMAIPAAAKSGPDWMELVIQ